MSAFADRLLLQLSDPAQLVQLLDPAADPTHARLKALIDAAYSFESATIHDVQNVQVRASELQRPIFPRRRTHGTWTRTQPSYERTDTLSERAGDQPPVWIDIAATVTLTLVLEVDRAEVASIVDREIARFATPADFRARFQFIDLPAYMAELGVATFDEMRDRYHHLLAEFRLKPVPVFNPADPANLRQLTLGLALLFRESIDVVAALRDAKLARETMERSLAYGAGSANDIAEARTPFAPLVVFPQSAVGGPPLTADALQSLFAGERILALFVTPA